MKTFISALAIGAALAMPAGASEESDYLLETAADLADLCDEPENPSAIHMCHGYMMGVHHMHVGISEVYDLDIYCIPSDTDWTRDRFSTAFSEWVKATPEAQAMHARQGLLTFAAKTFPCN